MKKLFLALFVVTCFFSCGGGGDDDTIYCVSCIAESVSGKIVNYNTECLEGISRVTSYQEGQQQFYKDHGDSVTVRCIYNYQ